MKKRRQLTPEFKARVALAALRGDKTIAQISSEFNVHSTQINRWKQQALGGFKAVFSTRQATAGPDPATEQLIEQLYTSIGKLKVENEWLKKKSVLFTS